MTVLFLQSKSNFCQNVLFVCNSSHYTVNVLKTQKNSTIADINPSQPQWDITTMQISLFFESVTVTHTITQNSFCIPLCTYI